MKYHSTQLNNEGFSLVELIVTILIIAVITTSTVLSISVVYNSDVEKAGKIFVASMNEARQRSITIGDSENSAATDKTDVYLKVYLNDKGFYCADIYSDVSNVSTGAIDASKHADYDTKQLGKYKMTMKFGIYNGPTTPMTEVVPDFEADDVVIFTFDKGSGGIKDSYVEKSDGTKTSYAFTDSFITGSRSVNLVFVRQTGRCYIYEDE